MYSFDQQFQSLTSQDWSHNFDQYHKKILRFQFKADAFENGVQAKIWYMFKAKNHASWVCL